MIIVIHENKEWMPPFEEAFKALHLEYEFWYVPEMNFNFQDVPAKAVYYNRISASSHTRNHRYEPELALGILEWLERYSRTVDVSSGINLYTRGKFKLNVLEVNKNYVYLKNLETNKVPVNLLSFKYRGGNYDQKKV